MRPPKWGAFATPVLAGYPEVVNHDLAVEIGLFRTCSYMISEKPQTGTGEQHIRLFTESLTPTTADRPESATSPHASPRACSTTCHRDPNERWSSPWRHHFRNPHSRMAADAGPGADATGLRSACVLGLALSKTPSSNRTLASRLKRDHGSAQRPPARRTAPRAHTENRTAWQPGQWPVKISQPLFPEDGNRKRLLGRDAGPPTWENNGRLTAKIRLTGAYGECAWPRRTVARPPLRLRWWVARVIPAAGGTTENLGEEDLGHRRRLEAFARLRP